LKGDTSTVLSQVLPLYLVQTIRQNKEVHRPD